ncbi:hypothetical protein AGABI2DRAFT_79403 [Agaricus bisporus var. bisporus H97]|uniref:hypothetical protein n=1 Tax=Agaricus bisporus var. bisporus (strain H97 / ATCC MYA-4626 / FGSC 10389) TaxID=936046 RepID=UPI00029F6808|nr:hypothetical protein AGABI2DRAFT_79403 [Agaricus bisporus var. bisporus H97]EKV42101.1 hypothetical protein AGABI2DRAFT_79403 [Agaricus bisporus var. bisporus H97]
MSNQTPENPLWSHFDHEELIDQGNDFKLNALPPIFPTFLVPVLPDKPQNPILDNIRLSEKQRERTKDFTRNIPSLPPELHIVADDLLRLRLEAENQPKGVLWDKLDVHGSNNKGQLLSWDALRPHNRARSSTPFLSERDSLIYASARYYIHPRLEDPSTRVVYVKQVDLFSSLKMTVLGNSSMYHSWDDETQKFCQIGVQQGERGFLLLDGKDEVVSNRQVLFPNLFLQFLMIRSVISRFLTIGNLLRRLDILLKDLRNRSVQGPTTHAFTHALSNILECLRKSLAKCPPSLAELSTGSVPISGIWLHYELYWETLVSLAAFCGREEEKVPRKYKSFNYSSIDLLSHIYSHLDIHLIRQSPRMIIAIFAYLLSCTSKEYFRQVSQSVGFGPQPPQRQERINNLSLDEYIIDEEGDGEEDIFDVLDRVEEKYPSFFPPELLAILPAAQKSLILLRKAQPDHALLSQPRRENGVEWLWQHEDIEAAFLNEVKNHPVRSTRTFENTSLEVSVQDYTPELEGFKVFDMEPGTSSLTVESSATTIQEFLDSFPHSLPPITPTLAHLSSVTLSKLHQHSSTLTSTLLHLFLDHPGELNLRSHLILLRDFLLLTSSPFKLKLSNALFSDNEDYEIDNENRAMSLQIIRQRKPIMGGSKQPWAVGLASALLEREIWPPVGADLSFFLRTVIVDSLEDTQRGHNLPKQVVNDASWRLGFAIRDLPIGSGRDRWLNPLCTALDFLYMDYKPPHPLEVLIPHEVLSKYQRMFTFLLRLIRVEHALHALHRMARSVVTPIFPTLTQSRKLFLHFRFLAQSFISALSGYVFDTVIGGNFDPFLAELSSGHNEGEHHEHRRFSDVFELAKRHSDLLDEILSACLMRSGQRAAGDLLRQTTEIALEFAVVIAELQRGRLQEYEAAPMVEDSFKRFRNKMAALIKVLRSIVDKNTSKSYADHFFIGQRNLPGGLEALHHLLLRIDTSDWWTITPVSNNDV